MGLFKKRSKDPQEELRRRLEAAPSDREKIAHDPVPAFSPKDHPDPAVANETRRLLHTAGAATSTLYGSGDLIELARMVLGSGSDELLPTPAGRLGNRPSGGDVEWRVESEYFVRMSRGLSFDPVPETRGAFFSGPRGSAFVHTMFPDADGEISLLPVQIYCWFDWEWYLQVSWQHQVNDEPRPDPAELLAGAEIVALSRLLG